MNRVHYQWITFVLFFTGLLVMFSLYSTITTGTVIAQDLSVPVFQAPYASMAFSFAFAFGCLVYGLLSDKLGRKRVMIYGLIAHTLFTVISVFSTTFTMFVVLRACQGLAAAAYAPIIIAYISDLFPAQKRVTATSFVTMGFLFAGIFGQVVSEMIANVYSWRMVFLILGNAYALLTIINIWLLPNTPLQSTSVQFKDFGRSVVSVFRKPTLLLCYIIAFFLLMTFINVYVVLGESLLGKNSQGVQTIAAVSKFFGVGGILVSLTAGKLSEHYSVSKVLTGALGLTVLAIVLMAVNTSLLGAILLSVLFGLGIGLALPTLISKVVQSVDVNKGFYTTLNTFVIFFGTAVAPVTLGWVQQHPSWSMQFLMLAGLISIAFIASIIILIRDRQKKGPPVL
ncbi:MFS transporter [Staphylococcus chromogenes]|uniref:MFS transporter n=1 Tax=Staphylococcus chromogenes TaxID=46126 RepID=UPI0021D235B9|nr:MFS transporter [Staphylococcus chromogenes]UXS68047.1 MFS transporter [Staphylococcus chromogenes]